jgi:hypothetical protein
VQNTTRKSCTRQVIIESGNLEGKLRSGFGRAAVPVDLLAEIGKYMLSPGMAHTLPYWFAVADVPIMFSVDAESNGRDQV